MLYILKFATKHAVVLEKITCLRQHRLSHVAVVGLNLSETRGQLQSSTLGMHKEPAMCRTVHTSHGQVSRHWFNTDQYGDPTDELQSLLQVPIFTRELFQPTIESIKKVDAVFKDVAKSRKISSLQGITSASHLPVDVVPEVIASPCPVNKIRPAISYIYVGPSHVGLQILYCLCTKVRLDLI